MFTQELKIYSVKEKLPEVKGEGIGFGVSNQLIVWNDVYFPDLALWDGEKFCIDPTGYKDLYPYQATFWTELPKLFKMRDELKCLK